MNISISSVVLFSLPESSGSANLNVRERFGASRKKKFKYDTKNKNIFDYN